MKYLECQEMLGLGSGDPTCFSLRDELVIQRSDLLFQVTNLVQMRSLTNFLNHERQISHGGEGKALRMDLS